MPNGHLPSALQSPEQAVGAQLRRMGDAFEQAHARQVSGGRGWDPGIRALAPARLPRLAEGLFAQEAGLACGRGSQPLTHSL